MWACLLGVLGLLGCASPPAVEQVSAAISGGQAAGDGEWPAVVWLPERRCSGVLVHPGLVLTAAHCGSGPTRVLFGERASTPRLEVAASDCRGHPAVGGPATDWGFCRLAAPVDDVPIAPVARGLDALLAQPGVPVVQVGFGSTALGAEDDGEKRAVHTQITGVDGSGAIRVGGGGRGGCYGDSGGPVLVQRGGSWRVLGIDSAGVSATCADGDHVSAIEPGLPWIEQQSGIALPAPAGCSLGGPAGGGRWGLALMVIASGLSRRRPGAGARPRGA